MDSLAVSQAAEPASPPAPRLDRRAIADVLASGRRLLVQGAMGIHASDGLSGKVAAARTPHLLGVGTVSAVLKSPEMLAREIRRAKREAPGGFVGVNLMAAINKQDFEALARLSFAEGVSFLVQGAGISRDVVKWCRDAGIPFAGIVSSGRLAKIYEKWGAEWLVAEGAEAGGHIGDVGHPLLELLAEVRAATELPVVAAGGIGARDLPGIFERGAAGAQLATRFLACSDGDVHPAFKDMHLRRGDGDVTLITSCVKGMKARAVRNAFTEALARGKCIPPRSKTWFFGPQGYMGRTKDCIECLGEGLCLCRESDFQESFCITDALLDAAVRGDVENGLFYTGQSVTGIEETDPARLPTVAGIFETLERSLDEAPGAPSEGLPVPSRDLDFGLQVL
jgi:NAD(P)H-dependent flavin oxidoreductase YrpB (nitropropane dioxygenase family)